MPSAPGRPTGGPSGIGVERQEAEAEMWSETEKDLHFAFKLSPRGWVALHSVPVLDLMTPQYLSPGRRGGWRVQPHCLADAWKRQVARPALHSELVTKSRMKPGCPAPVQLLLSPHMAPKCSFSRSFLEDFVPGPGAAGALWAAASPSGSSRRRCTWEAGEGPPASSLHRNGTRAGTCGAASVLPEPALNTNQGASIELKITG